MEEDLQIVGVDRLDKDRLVVNFSDRTTAIYTVEELAKLRPERMDSGSDDAGQ